MDVQGTVLVVDDEESVRFSLERFLQKAGHEVSVAADIAAARALLETRSFDTAIVDRILANGENGLDLVSDLRAKHPFCQVILISAYPSFRSATQVLSAGAFAYITKPVRKSEILKTAEEAVKRSFAMRESDRRRRLFHSFFDHSSNAILIYDLAGRVRYLNEQFTNLFGYTREESLGTTLPLVPESDLQECLQFTTRVLRGERVQDRETVRIAKDGREVPVSLSLSACCDDRGTPTDLLVVMRDISRSLALRKQVRKAQTMEALGTLARGIVHDFNNVLQGIRGYLELAMIRMQADQPVRQDLDMAYRATDRAQELVKQISAFGDRDGFRPVPVDVALLVREAMDILSVTANPNITLRCEIDTKSPPALADPTQIHQVVMNLCTNACQAMSENGGVLDVGLAPVRVQEDDFRPGESFPQPRPGDYLRLSVKDTGIGMDAETQEHLFEPFFTHRDRGTGIGLSVVYGIVKRHGGEITVRSEPGGGTVFETYFPRAEDDSEHSTTYPDFEAIATHNTTLPALRRG